MCNYVSLTVPFADLDFFNALDRRSGCRITQFRCASNSILDFVMHLLHIYILSSHQLIVRLIVYTGGGIAIWRNLCQFLQVAAAVIPHFGL